MKLAWTEVLTIKSASDMWMPSIVHIITQFSYIDISLNISAYACPLPTNLLEQLSEAMYPPPAVVTVPASSGSH
jgi:hypothetical protein